MLLNPLSLMGSSYADNSLPWSAQRTLNWLPETAEVEGTRTPIKFADVPGLRAVVDLGTGAPIRGLHNVEGKLFAVSGTSLFEIDTDFISTSRGSIPGVARVSMAHNKQGGAAAANELVIANGLSGYVYNTSTASLAQITDDAFQGASTVDYVDGYITFTDPQGRFWGHSALNQATSFSSIDRYDAESAPDPIISHIVSHREVMVFGTRTTEFFRNTGAATGTFQRVDGTELEVGICAPMARSRIDNSVCWVSDSLEVFRLEGHAPQRISTRPIEQMLHTVNPANLFTFAWEDRGHKVFYVTAPEAFTLGFDFASGMWHERQTFDLPRWRINDAVAWNGHWIVGDYSNGLLYVLDWHTHHENGLPIVRERASGYTHGGQNKVLAPYVELLFDTGVPTDEDEDTPVNNIVLTGDFPDGFLGSSDPYQYTASGGFGALSLSVISGALPTGRTMNSSGLVTGASIEDSGPDGHGGPFTWVIRATDMLGNYVDLPDSAIITSYAMTVYEDGEPDGGPLYYYKQADTTAVAVDSGPFADNATYLGSVVHGITGLVPNDPTTANDYPGGANDRLDVPDDNKLNAPVYTVELLVEPDVITGGVRHLVNRDSGLGNIRVFQLRQNNADLEFTVFEPGGLPTPVGITSPGCFVVGEKCLIDATCNALTGEVAIYKNGTQLATGDFNPLVYTTNYGHSIGGDDGGISGTTFDGTLQHVVFYGSIIDPARMVLRAQIAGILP